MKRLEIILVIWLLSIQLSKSIEFDDYVNKIKENLKIKSPLKDSGSFSKIPGPGCKSTSKIGIVGAGISGIHMAYELKRMGFKNVEILEKSGRIGGLIHEVVYEGFTYGLTALIVDYVAGKRLIELFKKFDLDKKIPVPFQMDLSSGINYLSGRQVDPKEVLKEFEEYTKIHRSLFGTYDTRLMPRPKPEVFEKVNGSFKEFLNSLDLNLLQNNIEAYMLFLGYRNLDNFGAMYGLAVNKPEVLFDVTVLGNAFDVRKDKGFIELLKRMIVDQNIKINYFYDVKSIVKEDNGTITVEGMNIISKAKNFDFLIWSGPKYEFTRISNNFLNPKEVKLLAGVRGKGTASALVVTENDPRMTTVEVQWKDCADENLKVGVTIDSYGDVLIDNGLSFEDYAMNNYTGIDGLNPPKKTALVTYLYGNKNHLPSALEVEPNIKEYFKKTLNSNKFEIKNLVLLDEYAKFWDSGKSFESAIWDLLDLQGKYNVWFLGAPGVFETTADNVAYNSFLLDIMDKSLQKC